MRHRATRNGKILWNSGIGLRFCPLRFGGGSTGA